MKAVNGLIVDVLKVHACRLFFLYLAHTFMYCTDIRFYQHPDEGLGAHHGSEPDPRDSPGEFRLTNIFTVETECGGGHDRIRDEKAGYKT